MFEWLLELWNFNKIKQQ